MRTRAQDFTRNAFSPQKSVRLAGGRGSYLCERLQRGATRKEGTTMGQTSGFWRIPSTRDASEEDHPRLMKRVLVGFATAALASGGLSLAGMGAGTAHADDDCSPAAMVGVVCYGPNHWCPGDSLFHLTQNHVHDPVTWDMNVCHTYWHVALEDGNQGQGIYEGPNPPPPQTPPTGAPGGPPAPPYLPPPPGMCWNMWIPGPCPGG